MIHLRTRAILTVLAVVAALVASPTPPAAGAPLSSPFGINGAGWSHLGANTDSFDWATGIRRLDSLQQMGAAWDRCDFWWGRIEPEKGRFVFRDYDRVVDEYNRRGLRLMPILCYDAAWHPNQSPDTDEYRAEYGRYVYETVSRYKGRLSAYEVWNEPNISIFWHPEPDVDAYVALLKVAYREAKRADPKATVVGGALAGVDLSFLDAMLRRGAGASMDALSIHPYQGNLGSLGPEAGGLARDLRAVKALLAKYGHKNMPVWITEMGNRTVPDPSVPRGQAQPSGRVSEQKQANLLVRSYAIALSEGVQRVFWFDLQDWPQETWGTIAQDFRRKPSWYAYRAMASTLAGLRPQAGRAPRPGTHLVPFGGAGRFVTLAWTEAPGESLGFRNVPADALLRTAAYRGTAATVAEKLLVTPARTASAFLNGEPVYLASRTGALVPGPDGARVGANPAAITLGDRFTLSVQYANAGARAALSKRPRAVVLYGSNSHASLKAYLEPAGKDTYRVRASLPVGAYSVGYAWLSEAPGKGKTPARFEATARLTVRPALAVSVAPDPSRGRDLRLTVTNNARERANVTARVDMTGYRTDTISDIVLGPHESRTLPVANVMPRDTPLTVPLPVIATVTGPGGTASWSGRVFFWAAPQGHPGPPLVLDSAQQWQSQDGTWTGPEDLSATITAWYDPSRLYLRADVTDDIFSQPDTGGAIWRGDSIQLAVDPRWARHPDTAGAVEFGLALTPEGPQVYRWTAPAGLITGADLKVTRSGDHTLYEAAIPWSALGVGRIQPPRTLGFSLVVNDNDGKDRQGWLAYGDGIAMEKRTDRYATLTLLK